ncbi:MAG: hypothetical protein M1830_009326 [Pleopsidium flavum]|nr:MAG: hypothetical protein M1830_009334 [Pleopsidium flavum]KAI9874752.1 MAG: hypothetical protein M1830_009326 [Pleopsidium flavum]
MLHEILLSLSGHPSPLLSASASRGDDQHPQQSFPILSPPEKALLASLAHLGDLHSRLQSRTSAISSSHPSTICRTVSTAIASTHLARFQRKILEVEGSILRKDSGIVGGYGIVPLSRIVDEFDIWTRRMGWLWDMVQFMLPSDAREEARTESKSSAKENICSGAALLNRLREEAQTGYPDLEEAALSLIKAGETAWLRQLSAWVLYGRLPALGDQDFFIHTDTSNNDNVTAAGTPNFVTRSELVPDFVTPPTASAILFVGRSLNQIRARGTSMTKSPSVSSTGPELALLPAHLRHLSGLSSPITKSSLSSAIATIRVSLSQNSLQQLLPLNKIQEILSILRNFLLLGRGEFAMALLGEADKRMRSPHQQATGTHRDNRTDDLGRVIMKEGQISAVLTQTWATLSTLQAHEDDADEELDLARELLHLSVSKSVGAFSKRRAPQSQNSEAVISEVSFDDFLFGTPTYLTIHVPSPLDLFLTPADLSTYSHMHSYIISVRRAHLHLTELWRLTSLRRDHPAPLGPPLSNTRNGEKALLKKRQRALERTKSMREVWATAGAAVFFLAEVGGYFQGEVIKSSWDYLQAWLGAPTSTSQRPSSATSRPTTSTSTRDGGGDLWTSDSLKSPNNFRQHSQLIVAAANPSMSTSPDPETLTIAHQRYLASLAHNLLLTDTSFALILRSFLTRVDHFVALITRLQSVQQNLDLETDEGVVDTFANYTIEEKELVAELKMAREEIDNGIKSLVVRLRDIDSERVGRGNQFPGKGKVEDGGFVPWKGSGVHQLLMKLDFTSLSMDEGRLKED